MRIINVKDIREVVAKLCKQACYVVTPDLKAAFTKAQSSESSSLGKDILGKILQNAKLAEEGVAPICQDTGMTVVFVQIGQDVHIEGGYIEDAINEGC